MFTSNQGREHEEKRQHFSRTETACQRSALQQGTKVAAANR